MTERSKQLHFPFFKSRDATVTFDGGDIVTDAGLLLVRQFEHEHDLIGALSKVIVDPRDPLRITHEQTELLRQRLFQIIAGYEDCNDANRLRIDPLFKTLVGRLPSDNDLGSQPTLTRLENRIDAGTCHEITSVLMDWFIASRSETPSEMTLEMDTSDAATYGQQVLTFYNAHYNEHMYFPMFLNDAATGYLLASALRPGNAGGSDGATNILDDVVGRLRGMRRDLLLSFRADSHFATPLILDWLEYKGIEYVIGLGENKVLKRLSADFVARVEERFRRTSQPQKDFTSIRYKTQKTWRRARRVIVKVEVTSLGTNIRFAVTNRLGRSEDLYSWCVQRGGTIESSIKQLKNGFEGDRLSCHTFEANRFRLLLHTAAHNLMVLFRERLAVDDLRTSDIHTLRIKLIKVAARVRQTARRLWFQLSSSWPFALYFRAAHQALVPSPSG
jgi:hypothetical protein